MSNTAHLPSAERATKGDRRFRPVSLDDPLSAEAKKKVTNYSNNKAIPFHVALAELRAKDAEAAPATQYRHCGRKGSR